MSIPTQETVKRAIDECISIGQDAFLAKYASGFKPKSFYVSYEDGFYPLKATWSAAHTPTIHNSDFITADANRGMTKLGFQVVSDLSQAISMFEEGEARRSESKRFARSRGLVEAARKTYGFACQACGFDFGAFYGEIGRGYIECHHLEQIASGTGESDVRSVNDIAVLCANCHRIVHWGRTTPLTLDQLRTAISTSKRATPG